MWLPPAFDSLAPQGFCLTPNLQLFANFFVTHHGCLHTILDHSFPHALLSRSQSSSAYGDALADFILVSCTKRKILRRPQILGGGPTVMALVEQINSNFVQTFCVTFKLECVCYFVEFRISSKRSLFVEHSIR